MRADNIISIIGRVGAEPEMKYISADRVVATFNVAVNRAKDSAGNEVTDWFKCEFWGKQAEVAGEYIKKGTLISVVGACHIEKWEQNGVKRSSVKIRGDVFKLLSSKGESQAPDFDNAKESAFAQSSAPKKETNNFEDEMMDDDIPPF